MKIKNYTSDIPAATSIAKIDEMLVEIGASNISRSYSTDKVCTGLTFLLYDERLKQTMAFHLQAQVNAAFNILWKEVKRPQPDTKKRILDQASRTAWKVLFDWVHIQCSMVLLGQAEPLQMFLPYVYDINNQETFYQKVIANKIKLIPAAV